jgi:signal transduction histidine kinase
VEGEASAPKSFLLRLSDTLRAAESAAQLASGAARLLGLQLQADRAYYGETTEGRGAVVVGRDHVREGLAPLAGTQALAGLGELTDLLHQGRTVQLDDVQLDDVQQAPRLSGRTREACAALDIRALLAVPLMRAGRLLWTLTVAARMPRAWTACEIALVRDAGERSRDALERLRAEQGLRDSEARFRRLFDSIDQGFCILQLVFDAHGQPVDYVFREVNAAFVQQTGLADAVGQRMRALAPGHEQFWFDTYGRIARSGRPERFEHVATALDRWYEVYAFRIGEPGQDLVAALFNDVSERKRGEQALQEADRNKDEFLAILAHELRNPLAPLRTALQIMKLARGDAEVTERARVMMERQVEHMVSLVDDLMDVSRISRGLVRIERRRVDLTAIARHAVEATESAVRQREHELDLQLPDDAVCVEADAMRMTQALSNLLLNAAKYTPRGGRLSLTVRKQDGSALACVADNGIGIPPEMLRRVFDLFTQVGNARSMAQGGLGIGLAIVKQIVAMHDGSVQAESGGPGQGSRFTVRLPLAAGTPAAAPTVPAPPAAPAAARRVLVADDNIDAAESLAVVLQLMGHEVHVVFDGQQAVEAAQRLRPQVVLLDIGMPRVDGIAAARRIRALPQGDAITLVAVTGWGQDGDRSASGAAGFDHHLVKPIDIGQLLQVIA